MMVTSISGSDWEGLETPGKNCVTYDQVIQKIQHLFEHVTPLGTAHSELASKADVSIGAEVGTQLDRKDTWTTG